MYAGLNAEEREALLEVTRMGFPPRAWFNAKKIAFGYTGVFTTLVDRIVDGDPTYFDDFWTKPGYLGANPTESLKRARIQQPTKIRRWSCPTKPAQMGLPLTMPTSQTQSGVQFPAALRMENLPAGNLQGASIIVKSGGAKGHILYIAGVVRRHVDGRLWRGSLPGDGGAASRRRSRDRQLDLPRDANLSPSSGAAARVLCVGSVQRPRRQADLSAAIKLLSTQSRPAAAR